MSLTVCICGGGSLGTVCAGIFLSKGLTVNLLTGHPSLWNKTISVKDNNNNFFSGELQTISDNPKLVVPKAEIVLLCVPGYLIEKTLESIKPYLHENMLVGCVVGSTGFFFQAHKVLNKQQPLFAFQRVPFISRYIEYGKSANLLGYKKELKVGSENYPKEEIENLFSEIFLTPTTVTHSYFDVSLSNSNPILHTGRLFSLWKNYKGEIYTNPIFFYSDWDDESSELVLKLDSEFIKLRDKLKISKDVIPSLLEYYEVQNETEFTKKIKSIDAFKNIMAPLKKDSGGFIPDFESRYFTEDFPYGLKFIKDLASNNKISTPYIDKVLEWGISKIM